MIDGAGVAKIMDFGIARRAQENDHSTTTIAGTPEYMAPEQIELRAMGPQRISTLSDSCSTKW